MFKIGGKIKYERIAGRDIKVFKPVSDMFRDPPRFKEGHNYILMKLGKFISNGFTTSKDKSKGFKEFIIPKGVKYYYNSDIKMYVSTHIKQRKGS